MGDASQVPDRSQVLAAHREAGGQLAAVFPIHYSRALLRAFDLLPVEVWGPPGADTSAGDAHLQTYTCSIVRCGLSFIEQGKLDHCAVLLVPHACDSLQGLGSTLLDFTRPAPAVATLYMPRGRRDADILYLAAELRRLYEQLAALTGRRPPDAELLAAAIREEEADRALRELLEARPRIPLSNREFYRVVRSREFLPAERFTPLAREVTAREGAPVAGIRVVLSGLVPEPAELLDVMDQAGVMIAADDMASSGRRLYRAGGSPDPFVRLAQGMIAAPPDSTRGDSVRRRLDHLLQLARQSGAQGVVYLGIKFCEPELFYIPQLNQGFEKAGIRTLSLEVDLADTLSDQVITRLEAFAETLS